MTVLTLQSTTADRQASPVYPSLPPTPATPPGQGWWSGIWDFGSWGWDGDLGFWLRLSMTNHVMFLSRDLSSWKPGRHFSFGWPFIKKGVLNLTLLSKSLWVVSDRIQTESTFGHLVYLICWGEICWDRRKCWSRKFFLAAWVFPENNTLIDIFW